MKALIVEDDPVDYILLIHVLKNEFEAITWCKFPNDALAKIENNKFDIIILDFILPEFDGVELLKCIRHLGVKTPAVFITGADDIKTEMEGVKLFINKKDLIKEKQKIIDCIREIRNQSY